MHDRFRLMWYELLRGDMMKNFMAVFISTLFLAVVTLSSTMAFAHGHEVKLVCDIWPPYQIQKRDTVIGLSTEMVQTIFHKMDMSIVSTQSYPWQRALQIFESGHADALFSANYTKDRETFAIYPKEKLLESPWVIWTRGMKNIKTMDDLKGLTVGVVMGYSYTSEFWTFIETYCKVEKVTTDKTNFKKLALGRVDAIAAEYRNGLHLLNELGAVNITPHTDIVIKRDGLYIIFNRKRTSPVFVEKFSHELKQFKTSPAYEQLMMKYIESLPDAD